MTKDREHTPTLDRYEQYFSVQDGKHYELSWQVRVISNTTQGEKKFPIERLELVLDSVSINERGIGHPHHRSMGLQLYNQEHPREQLDLRCNCHGFTFADGHCFISNDQVALLLADEFESVNADEALASGNFDIVCFKEPLAGSWIHSAKYQRGLFMHKRGLHAHRQHESIREVVSFPDYRDSIPYYFRRIVGDTTAAKVASTEVISAGS